MKPPEILLDAEQALATYRRFAAMEAAGARLIFGHDPQQWLTINDGEVRELTFAQQHA